MPTTYPSTRTAYKNIPDKTFIPPTNENKVLNYGFTKENIHDVYLLPFLVTDETKLIAFQYIIWQGSLGVNPGVLIGSFLVGILPYGPFPWKWS